MEMAGNGIIMIRNAILIYLLGTILLVIVLVGYIANSIVNKPQYYINIEGPLYVALAINSLLVAIASILEYIGFRQLSNLGSVYRFGVYGAVLQLVSLPFSIVGAVYYIQTLENSYKVSNIPGFMMQALPVKVNSLTYLGAAGSLINLVGWLLVFVVLYKLGSDNGNGIVKTGSLATIIGLTLAISVVSYVPMIYSSYNAINTTFILLLFMFLVIGGLIVFIGIIMLLVGLTSLARTIT